jgi:hypothetical protein
LQNQKILWNISKLENTNDYNLEFNITKANSSSFFPIKISFSSSKTISNIFVEKVINIKNNEELIFTQENLLESYECLII